MKALRNGYISETELIKAAQHGDLEAFNLLIPSYQNLLFGIALGITKDEDAAADAVQEALISAFRNFATFRGLAGASGDQRLLRRDPQAAPPTLRTARCI
jgi:hypothetical protein